MAYHGTAGRGIKEDRYTQHTPVHPMKRSPITSQAAPLVSKQALVALVSGLMMGQVVAAISIHREGTLLGLVLAVVFVVSGAASLMLALLNWSGLGRGARQAAVHGWLAALGGGLLLSLQACTLL